VLMQLQKSDPNFSTGSKVIRVQPHRQRAAAVRTLSQEIAAVCDLVTPDRVRHLRAVQCEEKPYTRVIQKVSSRLRILPLQRCGHDGAQACQVFGFFVKARTQFADI